MSMTETDINPLEKFVTVDLPSEKNRIMRGTADLAGLKLEVGGTLIQLMIDGLTIVGQQLADLQAQILDGPEPPAENMLTPEAADVVTRVILSYQAMATALLQGSPPNVSDPEVRKAVEESLQAAVQAQRIVEEAADAFPYDGDDDGMDDEAEPEPPATTATA